MRCGGLAKGKPTANAAAGRPLRDGPSGGKRVVRADALSCCDLLPAVRGAPSRDTSALSRNSREWRPAAKDAVLEGGGVGSGCDWLWQPRLSASDGAGWSRPRTQPCWPRERCAWVGNAACGLVDLAFAAPPDVRWLVFGVTAFDLGSCPPDTHKTENRDVGPLASQFSLGAWPMFGRDGIGQSRESLLSALGSVTSSPPRQLFRPSTRCDDVSRRKNYGVYCKFKFPAKATPPPPGTAADLVEHNEPLTRRAETSQGHRAASQRFIGELSPPIN
jgi:hypothetical protein